MRFSEPDRRVLGIFGRLYATWKIGKWMPFGPEARLLRLPEPAAADLLDALADVPFRVMTPEGNLVPIRRIPEVRMPLFFSAHLTPRGLSLVSSLSEIWLPLTQNCAWLFWQNQVIRVQENQRELLRYLYTRREENRTVFSFSLQETPQVVGEILPWLKLRADVEVDEVLRRRLVQLPLDARVYFDKDGPAVVGRVEFRYGDTSLDPFQPVREKIALDRGEKLLMRDAEAEHRVLDILANAGFRVMANQVRLTGTDAIYDFVSSGVQRLQAVCAVFLSRDFRKITPRKPSLSGSLRMSGDRLLFSLSVDEEPTPEAMAILEALSRRRKYYRMKDGTFLDLQQLEGWQQPAEELYEAAARDGAALDRDDLSLRAYRTGYLLSALKEAGLPVDVDDTVQQVDARLHGEDITSAPDCGIALRDYQQRGYQWLWSLDQMRMGGILADDMGLGKTIQVIALLRTTRQSDRTSLIVAPTSLTYNWLSELNRFAPELSAAVVNGSAPQRARVLRHVAEAKDVDVIITSYPLIRRDVDLLAEIAFRFVILDEAQNIKNAGSYAAAAVKRLQGDTRLALTGTPMENGIGELWSIFDFVLPGYLPNYHLFLRRYQDGANSADLQRRIRPFLTRRLKQDVLSELPDKVETRLTALMTPEQQAVYDAAMERLRPKVRQLLADGSLSRSRMEVLSAITELREICCHPSLVLDGYTGSSGKMDMLLELLPGMIRSGRRILIFSQFTSMLKILRPKLEEQGWPVMYLDGDTPAGERVEDTEKFNTGDTPLFLISLRAGGSGLNLTGADTVIHYDPWWNPAAEDQATDRAHRIGQTRKVDVLRLVMGNSIEEQVVELGERKKALFDRLITPGETPISALSEQDIRSLFI